MKEHQQAINNEQRSTRYNKIIKNLPYRKPFLFVDDLIEINENGAEGTYTFSADADFYKGHFKNGAVTPGVLLTECCAQIGVVSLGIYLLGETTSMDTVKMGMSSSEMEFYIAVMPNEKVRVVSKKIYFRFHKLKCEVKMYNIDNKLVCKGFISGIIKSIHHE